MKQYDLELRGEFSSRWSYGFNRIFKRWQSKNDQIVNRGDLI